MSARGVVLIAIACAGFAANVARAQDAAPPRYAAAIEQELSHMGIAAQCAREPSQRFHCSWRRALASGAGDLALHAVYSDESDTIYLYVERYLVQPSDAAQTPALLRRLMELNWELLVGKLEWSPRSGEVRLSATLSTDSNFDRRAFRSTIRALESVAERYRTELQSLSQH
jgi:hypothetical protein